MTPPADCILLDTCAVIWLASGTQLSPVVMAALLHAAATDGLVVSPASAWEIGLLSRPRQGRPPAVQCLPDPKTWFARFLSQPGIRLTLISPAIAIDASYLPGDFHADPMDRLIVATARHHGIPVATRDRKILDYAAAGYLAVIPC